jgi:hypothetical protein
MAKQLIHGVELTQKETVEFYNYIEKKKIVMVRQTPHSRKRLVNKFLRLKKYDRKS